MGHRVTVTQVGKAADTCPRHVAPPRGDTWNVHHLGGLAAMDWLRRPLLCVSQRRCLCHLSSIAHLLVPCLSLPQYPPQMLPPLPYKNPATLTLPSSLSLGPDIFSHNRCRGLVCTLDVEEESRDFSVCRR